MKKVVRMVAIGALSGLAFLTACFGSRGLSRAERKKLMAERDTVEQALAETPMVDTSTMGFVEFQSMRYSLMNKLDSINFRLGEDVNSARNIRRRELQLRLDAVSKDLFDFENAVIYGSPEMLEGRDEEYNLRRAGRRKELETRLKNAKTDLETFDQNPDKVLSDRDMRRIAWEQRLESLRNIIVEREGSRVYGSPEIINAYRKETDQLRHEADSIEEELDSLKALERQELEEQIKKLPVRKAEGRAADVLYGSPTPRNMK
jgi:hypothetical protein